MSGLVHICCFAKNTQKTPLEFLREIGIISCCDESEAEDFIYDNMGDYTVCCTEGARLVIKLHHLFDPVYDGGFQLATIDPDDYSLEKDGKLVCGVYYDGAMCLSEAIESALT